MRVRKLTKHGMPVRIAEVHSVICDACISAFNEYSGRGAITPSGTWATWVMVCDSILIKPGREALHTAYALGGEEAIKAIARERILEWRAATPKVVDTFVAHGPMRPRSRHDR